MKHDPHHMGTSYTQRLCIASKHAVRCNFSRSSASQIILMCSGILWKVLFVCVPSFTFVVEIYLFILMNISTISRSSLFWKRLQLAIVYFNALVIHWGFLLRRFVLLISFFHIFPNDWHCSIHSWFTKSYMNTWHNWFGKPLQYFWQQKPAWHKPSNPTFISNLASLAELDAFCGFWRR